MVMKNVKQPIKHGHTKVPVIMQMEAVECGAASLCMVLAYFGKWIPLEQVRRDCGISRDGSKLTNIVKAANAYGLETKTYKLSTNGLKKSGEFPCILYWGFNHFVVCDGFAGGKVCINDPAKGEVRLSIEQFDEEYTGIALFLRPGQDFVPEGKPVSMIEYTLKKLKKNKTTFFFVALTTAIVSLLGIFMTGFSRVFLDKMLTGLESEWYGPFLLLFLIVALFNILTAWIKAIYSLKLNGKMAIEGNASYVWKILNLPMEFFSQRYAGDIMSRKKDNAIIAKNITEILAPIAINTVMLIFYLVCMIRYSPLLTVICVVAVLLQMVSSQFIAKTKVNITRVIMRDRAKLDATTVSAMSMIETIKASGAEDGYFERWAGIQASVNKQNVRYHKINQYMGMIPEILGALMNVSIIIIGVYLTITGDFSAGMVLAFQGLLTSFMQPAKSLIDSNQQIQEMRTQMERIDDVMEYPEDVMLQNTTGKTEAISDDATKLKGRVELRDVTFGYSPLDEPLIKNFNMVLEPGQSVAFVGASGCGKSTLTNLITGLYQPWSGEILLDDKPIGEIDHRILTASSTVIEQDIVLFEDTIENNIKMWDKTIDDIDMIKAAKDANIHDIIMKKEDGYGYVVKEAGRNFSGGEKQRFEIARALVKDPTILIMDEATSALDAKSEYEITSAIRNRGITCVIIAHRLSTIRDCDEIIVLDQGKIVERGTHDELYANNGLYKSLVTNA